MSTVRSIRDKRSCVNAPVRLDHRDQCNDQSLKLGVVVVRASRIETSEHVSKYFNIITGLSRTLFIIKLTFDKRNNGSDPIRGLCGTGRDPQRTKSHTQTKLHIWDPSAGYSETRTRTSMPRRPQRPALFSFRLSLAFVNGA